MISQCRELLLDSFLHPYDFFVVYSLWWIFRLCLLFQLCFFLSFLFMVLTMNPGLTMCQANIVLLNYMPCTCLPCASDKILQIFWLHILELVTQLGHESEQHKIPRTTSWCWIGLWVGHIKLYCYHTCTGVRYLLQRLTIGGLEVVQS